jgi:HSP20 family molecular chaperone IbpA
MSTEAMTAKQANGHEDQTEHTRTGPVYRPNVDILELPHELLVHADVPGLCGEEIDINFEDGTLTIHGRVKSRQADDADFLLREYGVGDFYRTFRVSEEIDPSQITAECRNGVLTLHLPKSEAAKPRKIQVQMHTS